MTASPFRFAAKSQTRLLALATRSARALIDLFTLLSKRVQGRPGADLAPAVRCARCSARRPHSSIQVKPNTRPSLRDGLTAYAALSREPNSFWPPSPRELAMRPARLDAPHLRDRLDRSDDGRDHTVLPYARPPAPQGSMASCTSPSKCWRDELNSAVRLHAISSSQGLTRPARTPRADAAASTASPARDA